MSLSSAITAAARSDIDDAYAWYEAQQSGRGDYFLAELQDLLAEIGRAPEQYGRVHLQTRAAPLPTSKFVIYYRIERLCFVVTAAQHASAHPRKWQRRR